jgi:outer membrane biosynthesis protein TonB
MLESRAFAAFRLALWACVALTGAFYAIEAAKPYLQPKPAVVAVPTPAPAPAAEPVSLPPVVPVPLPGPVVPPSPAPPVVEAAKPAPKPAIKPPVRKQRRAVAKSKRGKPVARVIRKNRTPNADLRPLTLFGSADLIWPGDGALSKGR